MQLLSFDNNIKFYNFESNLQLTNLLSNEVYKVLRKDFTKKKVMCIAGGKTPFFLYTRIFKKNINWNNVRILLTDERIINKNHIKRNQSYLEKILKSQLDKEFIYHNIADTSYKNITSLKNFRMFDLTILGMGDDGHVASLFDEKKLITKKTELIKKMLIKSKKIDESFYRISLNSDLIKRSQKIFLYIKGYEKMNLLRHALNNIDENLYPISNFLRRKIDIFWCP